jgi:hypothetical protein
VEDVEDENDDTVMYVDATTHWAKKPYYISTEFRIEEDTFTPKLIEDCKEFVAKTDKLVREYQREWIELEQDRDYDDLISCSRFNDWEQWEFIEHFVDPFLEKYPEYEEYADIVDEILREEMYNQDKYECIVL